MKNLYVLSLAMALVFGANAQCVVNSNDNNWTQADVNSCLAGCTMNCTIDIQANVSLDETIDLTGIPGLTFTISGTGNLTLNGGNDLLLSSTSTLVVTSTATNPLKTNEPDTEPVITIGSTTYTDADFTAIVAAGGADANGALPIELASFTGKVEGRQVNLEWVTISEINNDYMAVEYSTDGRLFEEIGKVQGAGTSNEINNYQFSHATPVRGANYYRLRQVDIDGTATYHAIISVEILQNTGIDVFPNPAQERLNIFVQEIITDGQVQIFDMSGRLLQQQSLQAGASSIELPIAELASGMYLLRIESANRIESLRFRKN